MSSPVRVTYLWKKRKMYTDAIKKIYRANVLYVVPLTCKNEMDPTKSCLSLLYVCTKEEVFIFDIILLKENGLTQELLEIMCSEMVKYVYCKTTTFELLGFLHWDCFVNVFDLSSAGPQYSPFSNDFCQNKLDEIRIADIDWQPRPFKAEEHIRAGYRIHKLMTGAIKNRLLVCVC